MRPSLANRESRLGSAALVLVVWLASAAVFYRAQWRSGWNLMLGNDGDSRLGVYFDEHWFQVLHGKASWLDPRFFDPVKGLLGWSDAFFLFQPLYVPLRFMGAGPFLATQLSVVLLSLVGFASFYALVRVAFRAGRPVALGFAVAFTFSNALWLHSESYQMDSLWADPLTALCAVLSWRAAVSGRRARAALLGFASGALAIMTLYTGYYVGYFSLMAAAVLLIVVLAGWRAKAVSALIGSARTFVWPVAGAVVGFGLGLWPFLETYLPAQGALPPGSYARTMAYAGRLDDLVNVGANNVMWSSAIHSLVHRLDYGTYEVTYAPTPILWVVAIVGAALCAWWLLSRRAARPIAARAAVALGVTTLVMALVPLHTRYFTMWAVLHHLPGANAMRAIDRAQLVTGFAAFLAAAAATTEVVGHLSWSAARHFRARGTDRRWLLYPVAALVLLVIAEQFNTTDTSMLSAKAQTALLASVPPAPASCRSFYVVDSTDPSLPFYESQIDAMLIAQKLRLATVNGYTAYNPPGWDLDVVGAPGYLASVAAWAGSHGVTSGLCQLDLAGMHWSAGGPGS